MASLLPHPSSSVLEKGNFCHLTLLSPYTHAIGLWVESVYQPRDTQTSPPPLSQLLRGGEGRESSLPSNFALGWLFLSGFVPLLMEFLYFWNILSSLLSPMIEISWILLFSGKCHLPHGLSQLWVHSSCAWECLMSPRVSQPCRLQAEQWRENPTNLETPKS